MLKQLKTACVMLLAFTLLTGIVYPLVMTGVAQVIFPGRANGSLIMVDGHVAGSELIGQPFNDPKYFWSRPSATAPYPYNAGVSSGSNLAVSNPSQLDAIGQRVQKLRDADSTNADPIPIDLVTASGSGLDPHISVAAAQIQIPRVARVRGISEQSVRELVKRHTKDRQFGIFGEPRVNVLLLNLAVDAMTVGDKTARPGA